MAPKMEAIKSLRESREPVRGLPAVLKHVGVATEASILAATRRTIGNFGGLALSFRGPVLRHGGSLKIIGDIPDGAAVVVEGDACYVAGYVLGNLLVSGHTEVRENISGLLITQRGNIRARGIVNRATVIAKLGRIRIGAAEGPDLVYAGTQLRIDERTRLGHYLAPRIRVDGEVTGGEFAVTTRLQALQFNHTDRASQRAGRRRLRGNPATGCPHPATRCQETAESCRPSPSVDDCSAGGSRALCQHGAPVHL